MGFLNLVELKNKFYQIFLLHLGSKEIVFRLLTIREAEVISKLIDILPLYQIHDWIIENCVIDGDKEYLQNTAPAGYVEKVSDAIVERSSIKDSKAYMAKLDEYRNKVNTLQAVAESYICSAYKSLKPSDIKNMTYLEQIELLSKAEAILGKKLTLEGTGKKGKKKGAGPPTKSGYVSDGPDVSSILSKEAADKPNFEEDNRALNGA